VRLSLASLLSVPISLLPYGFWQLGVLFLPPVVSLSSLLGRVFGGRLLVVLCSEDVWKSCLGWELQVAVPWEWRAVIADPTQRREVGVAQLACV